MSFPAYTGAPDECPWCWPHKLHDGVCEDACHHCINPQEWPKRAPRRDS